MNKKYTLKGKIAFIVFLIFLFSNGFYTIVLAPDLDSNIRLGITMLNLLLGYLTGRYLKTQKKDV